MRKITLIAVFTTLVVLCSSFNTPVILNTDEITSLISEDLESTLEREMLGTVEYIEEEEEIDLSFEPYFNLPLGFNAYEGMEFELNEIEYIELQD